MCFFPMSRGVSIMINQASKWGAWGAHSIERPTLGSGSGRDLRVVRLSPMSGSALSRESAGDSLPLAMPLPWPVSSLSQINK